jgi:hypothetical protein
MKWLCPSKAIVKVGYARQEAATNYIALLVALLTVAPSFDFDGNVYRSDICIYATLITVQHAQYNDFGS